MAPLLEIDEEHIQVLLLAQQTVVSVVREMKHNDHDIGQDEKVTEFKT